MFRVSALCLSEQKKKQDFALDVTGKRKVDDNNSDNNNKRLSIIQRITFNKPSSVSFKVALKACNSSAIFSCSSSFYVKRQKMVNAELVARCSKTYTYLVKSN